MGFKRPGRLPNQILVPRPGFACFWKGPCRPPKTHGNKPPNQNLVPGAPLGRHLQTGFRPQPNIVYIWVCAGPIGLQTPPKRWRAQPSNFLCGFGSPVPGAPLGKALVSVPVASDPTCLAASRGGLESLLRGCDGARSERRCLGTETDLDLYLETKKYVF